jgi:hypothetical protein
VPVVKPQQNSHLAGTVLLPRTEGDCSAGARVLRFGQYSGTVIGGTKVLQPSTAEPLDLHAAPGNCLTALTGRRTGLVNGAPGQPGGQTGPGLGASDAAPSRVRRGR